MTPSVCCSRRLPSAGALQHPWLQHPQPSTPKALSKDRIRQFLARRKWQVPAGMMGTWGWLWLKGSVPILFPQKTGKALLALKRLTLLSQSMEGKASEAQDEEGDGSEAPFPPPTSFSLLCPLYPVLLGSLLLFFSVLGATEHPGMAPQWHFCSRAQGSLHPHPCGAVSGAGWMGSSHSV